MDQGHIFNEVGLNGLQRVATSPHHLPAVIADASSLSREMD